MVKLVKLNDTCKKEICEVLKTYANGEVYTDNPDNGGRIKSSVTPHYYDSRISFDGKFLKIRRIRFLICSANRWNVSEKLEDSIISGCKDILDKHNIKYIDVSRNYYYPRCADYSCYICLDILCEES